MIFRFSQKRAGWTLWWPAWSVALPSPFSWRHLTSSQPASTTKAWMLEGRDCCIPGLSTAFSKSSAQKDFGASTRVGLRATSASVPTRFSVSSSGMSFESCIWNSAAQSISEVEVCAWSASDKMLSVWDYWMRSDTCLVSKSSELLLQWLVRLLFGQMLSDHYFGQVQSVLGHFRCVVCLLVFSSLVNL